MPTPQLLGFTKVHKFLEAGELTLAVPAPPVGGYQWHDWFLVLVWTEVAAGEGWSPPGAPWATDLTGPRPFHMYRRWHGDDTAWVSSGHTAEDVSSAFMFAFRDGGMVHNAWPAHGFEVGGLGSPRGAYTRVEVPSPLTQDTVAILHGLGVCSTFDGLGRHINTDPAITSRVLYRNDLISHVEDEDANFLAAWTAAIPAGTAWANDVPNIVDFGVPLANVPANWEAILYLAAAGAGRAHWHFVEYELDPTSPPSAPGAWSVGFINTGG